MSEAKCRKAHCRGVACCSDGAQRNPGSPFPHCAEFIIGRRFAPTRWLHAGYCSFRLAISIARQIVFDIAGADDQQKCMAPERGSRENTGRKQRSPAMESD
jgi:hypothetical protein